MVGIAAGTGSGGGTAAAGRCGAPGSAAEHCGSIASSARRGERGRHGPGSCGHRTIGCTCTCTDIDIDIDIDGSSGSVFFDRCSRREGCRNVADVGTGSSSIHGRSNTERGCGSGDQAIASGARSAAAPERCASLGPYAARADADAALARLRGQTTRTRVREDKDAGVSTFRVMLPNVGDRAAAQALVKRIAAAGMGDYYVIAQGEDSSIALGQYQSRERAERRQASLVGAGFPAQLLPSGTGQSRWWIDVRSTAAIGTLQGTASAARQRSLDCAALR